MSEQVGGLSATELRSATCHLGRAQFFSSLVKVAQVDFVIGMVVQVDFFICAGGFFSMVKVTQEDKSKSKSKCHKCHFLLNLYLFDRHSVLLPLSSNHWSLERVMVSWNRSIRTKFPGQLTRW